MLAPIGLRPPPMPEKKKTFYVHVYIKGEPDLVLWLDMSKPMRWKDGDLVGND